MESENIRASFAMKPDQTGILINKVYPLSHASTTLEKDDVLLSIDGQQIGNDGTIHFRDGGERISFRFALLSKFEGDAVKFNVLRNGQVLEDVEVKTIKPGVLSAVPANQYDMHPKYFIFAGLVFQVLTQPLLAQEWSKEWQQKAPVRFVEKALYAAKEHPDQEIVILSQVLAADINVMYQQYGPNVCTHFNRVRIENLSHLVQLVENNTAPFLRFDLESERVIILNASEAAVQSQQILESHNIPFSKSSDLRRAAATTKTQEEKETATGLMVPEMAQSATV